MAYRNDRRDNYDRRTRTARGTTSRPTPRKVSKSSSSSGSSSEGRESSRSTRAGRAAQSKAARESTRRSTRQAEEAAERSERESRSTRPSRSEKAGISSLFSRSSRTSRTERPSTLAERTERTARPERTTRTNRTTRDTREPLPGQTPRAEGSTRFTDGLDVPHSASEHEQTLFAVPGGLYEGPAPDDQERQAEPEFVSTSVGELRRTARAERTERLRKSSRRYLMRFIIIIGVIVALLAGWAALYNSPAFTIEKVQVNGVTHLTDEEMSQLASVPAGTTLLRVDTEAVRNRLKQTAWVEDAEVKRIFPSTLQIDVTERTVQAIVEIPTSSGSAVKSWAIAEDHMWLMPIPDADSEAAKTTSAQIYADAEAALHIVDVPYGTKAEIGEICTDSNVNNALEIVNGMTTELSGRVVKVKAAGPAETSLILDNGVEIAFGKAEDIRDKERVILKILEENPDGVAYINVRMVEQPTWRAV